VTTPYEQVVGSLCTGYGGLDLGLELAIGPVRHAWHVEYDAAPSKILAARFPNVPNHGDLKTLDYSALEPVDWLTAGYPCQPFSNAGLRLGEADARHIWPYVADTIGALRPRGVLLENVAAHLRRGLDTVLADLAALGYDASWGVVRASDAGAPHERARVFIVATAGDTASGGRDATPAADEHHERQPARAAGGSDCTCITADADRRGCPEHEERDSWSHAGGEASQWDDAVGHLLDGTKYEPAVRRWEHILGRPVPAGTDPRGRGGVQRLAPRFVEWMMGLPDGWVTAVNGLTANEQLTALGNGVVPQQAALAVRLLVGSRAAEVAA
jgi:DNA (cytosine-5)-methyltransferase 1